MILREYASNQPYVLISVPLLITGILMPSFWYSEIHLVNLAYPADSMLQVLYTSKIGTITAAMVLLLAGSFLSNAIFNRHEFFNIPSYVPALLYALVGSTLSVYQLSVPALLGALFLLLGVNRQLSIYRQTRVLTECFETGFWFGMASVIYPPFVCVIAASWISLLITRSFNWREHLLLLLAFCVPFVYWIVWKYWNNDLDNLVLLYRIASFDDPGSILSYAGYQQLLSLVLVVAFGFSLSGYVFMRDRSGNKSSSIKNSFFVLSLGLIASFLLIATFNNIWMFPTVLLPIVFICGYWFTNYRYSLPAPFVFYALVIVCILSVVSHYGLI